MRVTIHRCPVCSLIGEHAANQAAVLCREPGVAVQVIDGYRGEYTISADGRVIAEKVGGWLPTSDEVLAAVRQRKLAAAGA
jgi:hypothetical protein